jgi:hypothetical protein
MAYARAALVMSETGKAALARAAMTAVEPMVELFLELGITSPEAESLLRGVFVHTARKWLASQSRSGDTPSDVRVSLVTGVHRNFVRQILAEPPRIAAAREQKGGGASRLLEAWHSDPAYLDSSGKPRDLPEKDHEPSFYSLAAAYLPGAAPGVVLEELRRAGLVQMLAEHRVRVRSRSFRTQGISVGSVGEMGTRARELLETLRHNLRNPASRLFCETVQVLNIDASRLSAVRNIINRRATTFLTAMENELAIEAEKASPGGSRNRVKVGLTVFETERAAKRQEGREES